VSRRDPTELFVDRILSNQQSLFAYILTLVPQVDDANDVLQETNLTLWRKREEFQEEASLWPWARTIAHYQALAFLKHRSRDRLCFNDSLLSQLAEETAVLWQRSADVEQAALSQCIEELPVSKQELLEMRYSNGMPVAEIARKTGRSPGAIADALYRIRLQLAECIEGKLGEKESEK